MCSFSCLLRGKFGQSPTPKAQKNCERTAHAMTQLNQITSLPTQEINSQPNLYFHLMLRILHTSRTQVKVLALLSCYIALVGSKSPTTNQRCITSHKSRDLNYNMAQA
jgi:hypothetical protein